MRRAGPAFLLGLLAAVGTAVCAPSSGHPPAAPPDGAVPSPETLPPMHEPATPTPRAANRLAKEASPYLLQHAHNPVDWYPWGAEAFDRAKREDKPVFLSIGYSTCHWCHVMERESFEDEAIAKLLNEHFVSIKVDREERPDVDHVYMAAVQGLTGQGGWPLSVFLTAEGKPFFGGTYFPPADRHGRPGMPTVLQRIRELWTSRRGDVLESAVKLTAILAERSGPDTPDEPSSSWIEHAREQFRASFDAEHAGFGSAPKFPRAFALSFLLARGRDDELRAMTVRTLDAMRRGGIRDQVGGGFHRYSTDPRWLVPHFEKMLYDQAILARAYLDAFQETGAAVHADTVRSTLDYVLRDLRSPQGGFLSAEDADSEGVEGKFYVWTENELRAALGDADAAWFGGLYGATAAGNFVDEAAGVRTGANILHLRPGTPEPAGDEAVRAARLRAKLLAVRAQRIRPHLDDKVLADWNGMMIGTMARAGAVLGEPRYVEEAARAAEFVLGSMRQDGHLLHRWRAGDAAVPGFLDDHAFLALGLHDLYEATFDPRWLRESLSLCRILVAEFQEADGTFRTSGSRGERLVFAPRELYDGAHPSGNSAAALALVRMSGATGDEALDAAGRRATAAWGSTIGGFPMGHVWALEASAWQTEPVREIVISGDPSRRETQELVAEARRRLLPGAVILLRPEGEQTLVLATLAPFTKDQVAAGGVPCVYVCFGRACRAPVTTPAELRRLLDE